MNLNGKIYPPPVATPLVGFAELAVLSDPARAARLSGFAGAWAERHAITPGRVGEERRDRFAL
jgi:hypothetical protein